MESFMSLLRASVLLGASLILGACGTSSDCSYERPVANIKLVEGPGTIIDSHVLSAADSEVACDREHTYTWSLVRVPADSQMTNAIFQGNGQPGAATQELNFDAPGTYVITMVIFDGVQNSVEAIYVIEIASDNLPPVALAGPDQGAEVRTLATFDGRESYDPELKDLEYRWTLEDAPDASRRTSADIFDADEAQAQFIADVAGNYVFGLQVKDEFVWSEKDYVGLVVVSDNRAPIAQASDPGNPSEVLTPCQSIDPIVLNGTRSWDPEGKAITYEWGLVSKPGTSRATVDSFSDIYSARPTFESDVPGDYTFELRVHDGTLWSAWDEVTVTVQDPALNNFPTADAGMDIVVEAEATCYNYLGTWKCDACPDPRAELSAAGSTDPDGDKLSYLWSVTAGDNPVTLSYPTGPITTITPSAVPAEYGKKKTYGWDFEVRVSDCSGTDTASVSVSMTCEGTAR
jgi:hypothetical protein